MSKNFDIFFNPNYQYRGMSKKGLVEMAKFKLFFVIIFTNLLVCCHHQKGTLYKTYNSPDNKYILEVYQLELSSGFRTHSDSPQAYVVLKDNEGHIIASPSVFNRCRFSLNDLSIEWYKRQQNKVYYTNISYIDIESGHMVGL